MPDTNKPQQSSSFSKGVQAHAGSVGATRIKPVNISTLMPTALSQEQQERLTSLDSRFSSLQNELSFNEHYDVISRLDSGITNLQETVTECRRRGYCYSSYLERKIETIGTKWQEARPQLLTQLSQAESQLQPM